MYELISASQSLKYMIEVLFTCFAKDKSTSTSEDEAAILLKEKLQKDLSSYPNAKGSIHIMTNIRLFGQKRNDIDMLIMGFFENLEVHDVQIRKSSTLETLNVKSIICNIEIKSHPATKVVHQGSHYFVYYSGVRHDASQQSFETKFSLKNHLADQLGLRPFICDILWFNGLSLSDLNQMRGNAPDNALPRAFSLKQFIETLLLQIKIDYKEDIPVLDAFHNGNEGYQSIVDLFSLERKPEGLTKEKFELISQHNTQIDELLPDVGKKLTIITGRAGTGKTIQLLQLAFKLAGGDMASRCLILTYNHALVSDIQRLIDYTPMPSRVDGRTVSIKTIHAFFHSIMKDLGINGTERLNPSMTNYNDLYEKSLHQLYEFVVNKCKEAEIPTLKDMAETFIDWDYLLIDESQDISDIEKQILFKLYGPQRLIVADGVDQFVRKSQHQEWSNGIDRTLLQKPQTMVLERRQKANLVTFVNEFAKQTGLDWQVRPNDSLPGGEIKIYPYFTKSTYDELHDNCIRNNCENYDILILEPPTQVSVDRQGNRYFSKADVYVNQAKIPIFDGINTQNRTTYPTKDQCRIYQYDSCRGLEGWCVVCADFDELIKYKMQTYVADERTLGLDIGRAKERYAYLWSLMPLTRPIDTLVITLTDKDSAVGKTLEQLAGRYPDFVEWNF